MVLLCKVYYTENSGIQIKKQLFIVFVTSNNAMPQTMRCPKQSMRVRLDNIIINKMIIEQS